MPREAALGRDKDFPAVLMWTSYASRAARAGPELRKSGQFCSTSCELVSPQNQLDKTPHRTPEPMLGESPPEKSKCCQLSSHSQRR